MQHANLSLYFLRYISGKGKIERGLKVIKKQQGKGGGGGDIPRGSTYSRFPGTA